MESSIPTQGVDRSSRLTVPFLQWLKSLDPQDVCCPCTSTCPLHVSSTLNLSVTFNVVLHMDARPAMVYVYGYVCAHILFLPVEHSSKNAVFNTVQITFAIHRSLCVLRLLKDASRAVALIPQP